MSGANMTELNNKKNIDFYVDGKKMTFENGTHYTVYA